MPKDPNPQWRRVAWSHDCTLLAYAESSGTVRVFDLMGSELLVIKILKPSPAYLKIIRGKHSVASLSCNSFTLIEMQCMRAEQQCNFPNSQLQKQGCWVTQPCLSQQVSNSPPTARKSSQWPIKRVKSLAQPTDSTRPREMPSLKCK